MNPRSFNPNHTRTGYVQLDTHKCKACWKCLDECPNQVIDKVDLPWHKHALLVKSDQCTGCLKCIKTCPHEAYSKIDPTKQETEKQWKRNFNRFLVNNLLLISGIVMVISGLMVQFGFHFGGPDGHERNGHEIQSRSMQYEQMREIDPNKMVYGFNYSDWSTIHKYAIIFFSLLMVYHIYAHWKWYKGVIAKGLVRKNFQVITLSALFFLVAATGLIPWFIDLSGGTGTLRMALIEIHDKLALILLVYLILHVFARTSWFRTTYKRIRKT